MASMGVFLKKWLSLAFQSRIHFTWCQWEIFRILKWRYVSTIFLAINWGDIPLQFSPYIGLIYSRYLQFRILKFLLMMLGSHSDSKSPHIRETLIVWSNLMKTGIKLSESPLDQWYVVLRCFTYDITMVYCCTTIVYRFIMVHLLMGHFP